MRLPLIIVSQAPLTSYASDTDCHDERLGIWTIADMAVLSLLQGQVHLSRLAHRFGSRLKCHQDPLKQGQTHTKLVRCRGKSGTRDLKLAHPDIGRTV